MVIVKEMLQPLNIGRNYDITPDGRLVAAVAAPQRSTRSGEIIVVLNWAKELKRRVPIEYAYRSHFLVLRSRFVFKFARR